MGSSALYLTSRVTNQINQILESFRIRLDASECDFHWLTFTLPRQLIDKPLVFILTAICHTPDTRSTPAKQTQVNPNLHERD